MPQFAARALIAWHFGSRKLRHDESEVNVCVMQAANKGDGPGRPRTRKSLFRISDISVTRGVFT
jgi:hypothetical protein